jgi:hypothetical protein
MPAYFFSSGASSLIVFLVDGILLDSFSRGQWTA